MLPTGWSTVPVSLIGLEAQWESDGRGIWNGGGYTWTWNTPYLSYFKVNTLEAITVNTGNLTIDSSGSIKSSGKTYGSSTAGFFLGYDSTAYKLDIGNDTKYLRWTGSELTFNGNLDVSGTAVISGSTPGYNVGNNTNLRTGTIIFSPVSGANILAPTATYGIMAVGSSRGVVGFVPLRNASGVNNGADGVGVIGLSETSSGTGVWGSVLYDSAYSVGVKGTSGNNVNSIGVLGEAAGSGIGVDATSSTYIALRTTGTGTATALYVGGSMAITSTSLVANLNADMVDGRHVGTGTNQIPINNDTLNAGLVAGYLGYGGNKYWFQGGSVGGTATATFSGTKPGIATTNAWLKIMIDGSAWYVPIWQE